MINIVNNSDIEFLIGRVLDRRTYCDMLDELFPILDNISDDRLIKIIHKYVNCRQQQNFHLEPYTRLVRVMNKFYFVRGKYCDDCRRIFKLIYNRIENFKAEPEIFDFD